MYNDPVDDRCSMPWGFLHYNTSFQETFSSLTQPHFRWMDENLIRFRRTDFEKQNYIGLVAGSFLIFLLINWLRKGFRSSPLSNLPQSSDFLTKLLIATLLIYIFSLGIPFIIPHLDALLLYTGPLKQFRSIGRFAWLFYFGINIITLTGIFYLSKNLVWKNAMILSTILLLYFEAYHFSNARNVDLDPIREWQSSNYFQAKSGLDFDQFQAILPIPYYNIGSDHFWEKPYNIGFSLQKSLILSNETGLPVTAAMLTRTSLSQTINQIQLVRTPYRIPKIFEDYPNDKPLLLAMDKTRFEEHKALNPHFENAGELLFEDGELQLYKLPLSSFEERIEAKKNAILKTIQSDSLVAKNNFLVADSSMYWVYHSFDESPVEKKYFGEAGLSQALTKPITLYDNSVDPLPTNTPLEFSIWMYINEDLVPRSQFVFSEWDAQNHSLLQSRTEDVHRLIQVFDNNGWAMVELDFQRTQPDSRLEFKLQNPLIKQKEIQLDELLIRPAEADIYTQTDEYIWKNNLHFKLLKLDN